jgi:hypothetical protein
LSFEEEYAYQYDDSPLTLRERMAVWDNSTRAGDKVVDADDTDIDYNNNSLPDEVFLEAIYPTTLKSDGDYNGKIKIKAECTLAGMTSVDIINVRQYLEINQTFYTMPYEEEYPIVYTNPISVTKAVKVKLKKPVYDPNDPGKWVWSIEGSATVQVYKEFLRAVGTDEIEVDGQIVQKGSLCGTGKMINSISYTNPYYDTTAEYLYLNYSSEIKDYYISETAVTSNNKPLTNQTAAKLIVEGSPLVSALDRPSDVYIPLLYDQASGNNPALSWLSDSLPEIRKVHDTGNPEHTPNPIKPKWLDIYVPYIPAVERGSLYQDISWTKFLSDYLRCSDNLKGLWVERE